MGETPTKISHFSLALHPNKQTCQCSPPLNGVSMPECQPHPSSGTINTRAGEFLWVALPPHSLPSSWLAQWIITWHGFLGIVCWNSRWEEFKIKTIAPLRRCHKRRPTESTSCVTSNTRGLSARSREVFRHGVSTDVSRS